jgi:membrane protease YdiL (CAAX protease family)
MSVGNSISQVFLNFFYTNSGIVTENPVAVAIDSTPWWLNLITTVILAPILEEILFRKVVCDRLAAIGEGFAVILSAAFFGLFHGNFYQLFYSFLIGAFLAFIYIKTGDIRYTIAYHIGINFFSGFVAPMIVDAIDFQALLELGTQAIVNDPLPYIALLIYETLTLVASVFGMVILIKKFREFKCHAGILQPPEKWAGPMFLNMGMAAAIAVFAFSLLSSLLI